MKKKLIYSLAGLSLILTIGVVSCVSNTKIQNRDVAGVADVTQIIEDNKLNYAERFGEKTPAKALTTAEIQKYATSTQKLDVKEAEVIIDNDAAFESKLAIIKSAQKEIRLTYFIFAADDSSSVLANALIEKAQQGVKVKMLVDFITNYGKLDLFQLMAAEGGKNMDIRFYNFPTKRILADAKYMTLPCPKVAKPNSDSCSKAKSAMMAQLSNQDTTFFSQLFLSGLYGKNGTAIKTSFALGAQVNPADFKGGDTSPEQFERLTDFMKLYFDAKVKNEIGAKIKLLIAMSMYSDELNPVVNEITGRLPINNDAVIPGEKTTHGEEWDHITDYTHHKLLAVDGREFQLGGRNIEDSYHMKQRLGNDGKYIFMDTDFRAVTFPGGSSEVERSFDKTFNFSAMVAPLSKVQKIMPNDAISNTEALGQSAAICMGSVMAGKLQPDKLGQCLKETTPKQSQYIDLKTRMANLKKDMVDRASNYNKNYVGLGKNKAKDNWRNSDYTARINQLTQKDLDSAEMYYVENTSFNLKSANPQRIVGSSIGAEYKFNKNIHQLWYRGLENTCKVSQQTGQVKRVILHSAYLFMPSGLIHKIAKMLNGDYGDCSRVKITLLTNSFATTDLNVINVFARYQLKELVKHYNGLLAAESKHNSNRSQTGNSAFKRWFPELDYYEYKPLGKGISLHTKLSVLGDDVIIGSANADTRSYYMDTNNAIFIRNAHEFNKDYIQFVDNLINDRTKTDHMNQFYGNMTDNQLKEENDYILGTMICRWDKKAENCPKNTLFPMKASKVKSSRFTPERILRVQGVVDLIGAKVTDVTKRLLNFRGKFDGIDQMDPATGPNTVKELNELSNEFDSAFKVL